MSDQTTMAHHDWESDDHAWESASDVDLVSESDYAAHEWESDSDFSDDVGDAAPAGVAYHGDVDDADSAFGPGSDMDPDEWEDARERTPGEEFVSYMTFLLLTRTLSGRQFCTALELTLRIVFELAPTAAASRWRGASNHREHPPPQI